MHFVGNFVFGRESSVSFEGNTPETTQGQTLSSSKAIEDI